MLKAIHEAKFGGEPWVLGSYQTQTVDKVEMEKGVQGLFARDFIKQWRTVIQTSRVNAYANLLDASNKLTILSGNEALLLALFWWTSLNTNVDIPAVVAAFQSVRQVVPPSPEARYVVGANQSYNNGLMKLQGTIAQAAAMPNGPDPAAVSLVQADALNATLRLRGSSPLGFRSTSKLISKAKSPSCCWNRSPTPNGTDQGNEPVKDINGKGAHSVPLSI